MVFISSSNTSNGNSKVLTVQGAYTDSAQVPTVSTDVITKESRQKEKRERDSYKKNSKVEEPAPKAMIAINGIGWGLSYMAEEDEASKCSCYR
nr:hypothetical protein [Tanacetum cinerariifolium]